MGAARSSSAGAVDCESWLAEHRDVIDEWWRANKEQIAEARDAYSWPPGTPERQSVARRDEVAKIVQRDVANHGSVSRAAFTAVLKWGFNGNASALEKSTDTEIESAAKLAIAALRGDSPDDAAEHLMVLPGIGISSATKVVALAEPTDYPIYDSRVGLGLTDLRSEGHNLIPIPPSRSHPGTRSSPRRLCQGFAEVTCLVRNLASEATREGGRVAVLGSVTDLEMGLFMMGGG